MLGWRKAINSRLWPAWNRLIAWSRGSGSGTTTWRMPLVPSQRGGREGAHGKDPAVELGGQEGQGWGGWHGLGRGKDVGQGRPGIPVGGARALIGVDP